MGSSRSNPVKTITGLVRNTGRAIKDNPEKALMPGALIGLAGIQEGQKRDRKKVAAAQAQAGTAARNAARKQALSEESVRAQKEKIRRQTIFAGGDIEQNIFRKTLGAGTGSNTLG